MEVLAGNQFPIVIRKSRAMSYFLIFNRMGTLVIYITIGEGSDYVHCLFN